MEVIGDFERSSCSRVEGIKVYWEFWESGDKEIRDSKYRLLHTRVCSCGKDRNGAIAVW